MAINCIILTVKRPIISEFGSILFTSTPSGADVYLAASGSVPIYTGLQTPNVIQNLLTGNYDYILKFKGYNDYNGTTTVRAGESSPVIANLILKIPAIPVLLSMPLIILIIDSII